MSLLREVLALDAVRTRRAWPARSRRAVHLSDDARQLVLFQFPANDFSVISVAYGRPGAAPDHVVYCSNPLDRSSVAAALEPVRDDMLAWLAGYPVVAGPPGPTGWIPYTADDMPQLIVAGAGVIAALDDLAYGWRYDRNLDPAWHTLGEELWHLCYLSAWPGSSSIVGMAETLADHYELGLSGLESAKLSVAVALCDAMNRPVTDGELDDAEQAESGPLGRPADVDIPLWDALQRGDRRPPAGVRQATLDSWDRLNRAWDHLRLIPEATATAAAHQRIVGEWARNIAGLRHNTSTRRRRALPTLAAAAGELGRMEAAKATLNSLLAAEDPLVAAGLAAEGKAARVHLKVQRQTVDRRTTITLTGVANQAVVPAVGALLAVAGTKTVTRLVEVTASPAGGWTLTLKVSSDHKGTKGIRDTLFSGPAWLVPALEAGPPPFPRPNTAPPTHPYALRRTPTTPSNGPGPGADMSGTPAPTRDTPAATITVLHPAGS